MQCIEGKWFLKFLFSVFILAFPATRFASGVCFSCMLLNLAMIVIWQLAFFWSAAIYSLYLLISV